MPTPEQNRMYQKRWYEKNKDKKKAYREKNKERILKYTKQYNQSPSGKKANRISKWKQQGVIHENFNELYEKFINTEQCELCECQLTTGRYTSSTTRVLDHCHETGQFRNILCHACNVRRG
tara:strand:- start:1514 stop:1876 length:363 start_codon:yes stop_codon:yes gene_type:complete